MRETGSRERKWRSEEKMRARECDREQWKHIHCTGKLAAVKSQDHSVSFRAERMREVRDMLGAKQRSSTPRQNTQ